MAVSSSSVSSTTSACPLLDLPERTENPDTDILKGVPFLSKQDAGYFHPRYQAVTRLAPGCLPNLLRGSFLVSSEEASQSPLGQLSSLLDKRSQA